MSVSLPEELASELNLSEEETRALIARLANYLRSEAKDGVTLPELGTLAQNEQGQLTFSPSPSLKRAVNHRFAGLTPVSVSGPSRDADEAPPAPPPDTEDEAEPAEPERADTDEDWQPPAPDDANHPLGPRPTPPFEEPEHEVVDDEPDEADEPPSDDAGETRAVPPPHEPSPDETDAADAAPTAEAPSDADAAVPVDEPQPAEDAANEDVLDDWTSALDEADETDETPQDEVEDEPAPAPATPAKESSGPPRSERPPVASDEENASGARIGLLVAVLLLLAIGGWFIVTQTNVLSGPSPETTATLPEPPSQTEDPNAAANQPTAESNTEEQATDTTTGSDAATPSVSTDEAPPAPAAIDPSAGGWTIVVASRTDRSVAESAHDTFQDRFQTEGLATGILTAESDGQTRFRVAVGQFDSRAAVLSALDQYNERLPDGAWALRLQPGM